MDLFTFRALDYMPLSVLDLSTGIGHHYQPSLTTVLYGYTQWPMCPCPTLEDAPDGPLLFQKVQPSWRKRQGHLESTTMGYGMGYPRKGRAKKWWDFAYFNGAEIPKQWWFIDKWVPGMVGKNPWKNHMSSHTPADNPCWFDFYRVLYCYTVQHIEDYHHNLGNPSQPESDDRGFWLTKILLTRNNHQPDPWNVTSFRVPAWIVSLCHQYQWEIFRMLK